MPRVNIYSFTDDGYGGTEQTFAGYFYPDKAERFDQDERWDGQNMVGVITGSNFVDQFLYRTPQGKWVLNRDAHRYNSGPDTYEYITDDQAREWLLRSECNDDAIERFFGPLEEEADLR